MSKKKKVTLKKTSLTKGKVAKGDGKAKTKVAVDKKSLVKTELKNKKSLKTNIKKVAKKTLPSKINSKNKLKSSTSNTKKVATKKITPAKSAKKPVIKPIKKIVVKKSSETIIKKKTNASIPTKKSTETVKKKVIEGVEINKLKSEKAVSKPKRGRSKKKKKGEDDEEPAIDLNDAFLQEILETVKPKKKGPKLPKQIRTFTNPRASLTVAKITKDPKKGKLLAKEPKGKFELEYVIGTSPAILYEFLTTPSGLSEWFADDVNIHDGVFTFLWDGSEQKALLLDFKEEKFIRFQWLDKPEGSYFEFRIDKDELTGDISLIVIDFADEGSDLQTSQLLWDSQIHELMHVIGSY